MCPTLADTDAKVKEALRMAAVNRTVLVLLPRTSSPRCSGWPPSSVASLVTTK